MRKTILALLLCGGVAAADTSADKKPGKTKPGGACQASSDCDQSSQAQICRNSKCEIDRPRPPQPPPPT